MNDSHTLSQNGFRSDAHLSSSLMIITARSFAINQNCSNRLRDRRRFPRTVMVAGTGDILHARKRPPIRHAHTSRIKELSRSKKALEDPA